jgi:flavin reductase (DIM6/NTAB) family NADH-FMN oxidoreductase RutF
MGANSVPILEGVLGYVECRLYATYDGGDHTIYLGEVMHAEAHEGKPLLFYRGGYRAFSDD